MVKKGKPANVVLADPTQWCEKSKRSVAFQFNFVREYKDIEYTCWRCRTPSVFTAEDQKYTYEVKKAHIDQRRILCAACWEQSNDIAGEIQRCEEKWAASKDTLKSNPDFLAEWLGLLKRRDEYGYKSNTAIKNMLQKLLEQEAGRQDLPGA